MNYKAKEIIRGFIEMYGVSTDELEAGLDMEYLLFELSKDVVAACMKEVQNSKDEETG